MQLNTRSPRSNPVQVRSGPATVTEKFFGSQKITESARVLCAGMYHPVSRYLFEEARAVSSFFSGGMP
jgi:hypothetical protein